MSFLIEDIFELNKFLVENLRLPENIL